MINLTIISENNKTVITKSLSDLSLNSFNSSENISIPYDNTIISIVQSSSSFNLQNLISSQSGFPSELNFFIVIMIFIAIIGLSIKALSMVKR